MINVKKLALSAMLLCMGLLLPFLTGQIPEIGNMLLPMHLPVLFCGLICGWHYGGAIGFFLPLLRSLLFGMPLLYPNAVSMAFELAAYGFVIGLLYAILSVRLKHRLSAVYLSLIPAMLAGRVVWGLAQVTLLGIKGSAFAFSAFLSGAFLTAIPGIILQLVLIPAVMTVLYKVVKIYKKSCFPHVKQLF